MKGEEGNVSRDSLSFAGLFIFWLSFLDKKSFDKDGTEEIGKASERNFSDMFSISLL